MKKKHTSLKTAGCAIAALLFFSPTVHAQKSELRRQGTATQLYVDNQPMIILGGELGNSSASCDADIERHFAKLHRMNLNTVLVPAYWDLLEPEEGQFDFSLTDKVIEQARKEDLKVVFLWFGAWKNSMSCYAPEWFKRDYKKYPRAYTRTGKPLEIASAFSDQVFQADNKAFTRWLLHIKAMDGDTGTVVMIQVENEIGMLEDARDYSAAANKAFKAEVPKAFTDYLTKNKKKLHPFLADKWQKQGNKNHGTWTDLFGNDIFTDEIFMAWHYASYVERMAQSARRILNVPLYVNAAMNSRGRQPGEYPSAGPLAHLIDVWRCAAPSIDLLAPDLYDNGFKDWVKQYDLWNNPLFIPEIRLTANDAARAFYVVGRHNAIGISPFSIENANEAEASRIRAGYATLRKLTPIVARHQGTDHIWGVLFDQENKEETIITNGLRLSCSHFFTLPWDPRATDGSTWPEAGATILQLAKDEFVIAGTGVVVSFQSDTEQQNKNKPLGEDGFAQAGGNNGNANATTWKGKRIGLAYVDEVDVDAQGQMTRIRRLNGDEDHQGRHARIGVDDFKILHVKLYEYE